MLSRQLISRLTIALETKFTWLLIFLAHACAQTLPQAPPAPQLQTAPTSTAQPGAAEVMLVKNALTAANHAVITGNFTVLRDLGSASFRQKNSAGDLAVIFKGLKTAKVDLSPILVMNPQFTQQPAIDQSGYLKLIGYFPTQPLQVRFALVYQKTEAGWVLEAISVGAIDPQAQANAQAIPPRPQATLPQPPAQAHSAPVPAPARNTVPYPANAAPGPVANRPGAPLR